MALEPGKKTWLHGVIAQQAQYPFLANSPVVWFVGKEVAH